jgi:hypothetical protein
MLKKISDYVWFEMTLNYWVIVERYSFFNGLVGSSNSDMKCLLDGITS